MEGANPEYAPCGRMTSAARAHRPGMDFSVLGREELPVAATGNSRRSDARAKKNPCLIGQESSCKRAARRLEANEGGREEEMGPEIANPEEGWSATETSLMLVFMYP